MIKEILVSYGGFQPYHDTYWFQPTFYSNKLKKGPKSEENIGAETNQTRNDARMRYLYNWNSSKR